MCSSKSIVSVPDRVTRAILPRHAPASHPTRRCHGRFVCVSGSEPDEARDESRHPVPEWEADVLLKDGRVAQIRPIVPEDAPKFVEFYDRVSAESKYFRFFAPYPRLCSRDI